MTKALAVTNKQLSFQTSKKVLFSKSQRKAETRTKIQLGGLLIKSGLANEFAIHAGADLQLNQDEREKATLLLGALIKMQQNLPPHPSQKEEWAILGRAAFVDHFLTAKENRKT
ncbi:MAG: conjugal transfer protein TraD [Alphaproteobacteria bacterium]|nr:conjugal transfer protein TraD [Alphaproteobacteria bacterium]